MKIEDVMRRFPLSVNVDDDLVRARELMVWMGIRHLPVMSGGKLVGILSERDVAAHLAAHTNGCPVERAMHSPVQTAAPTDSITEAAGRMAEYKIGCLPVTDKGTLVGLVTSTDILNAQVRKAMAPSPPVPTPPLVRDVMTRDPQTVHPDDHLLDAAGRMQAAGVRHLPVVNGNGEVIGMLSDRDVRSAVGDPRRALRSEGEIKLELMQVRDVMSSPAITVREDESCADVARHFANLRVGSVPVLDHSGALVGILSYIDIVRVLAEPS